MHILERCGGDVQFGCSFIVLCIIYETVIEENNVIIIIIVIIT